MSQPVHETGSFSNISTSTLVKSGAGKLLGIFCASASSTPTIKVWDSTAASGTVVVNTFTPIPGNYHAIPADVANGIYVTISGTVDCTVFFSA